MKQPRILILLDGSSSMLQPWANNDPRFRVAGQIVSALMDSIYRINSQVEFALRVYGHQHSVQENNCFDTRREVSFAKDNRVQMFLRINSLHPSGVSPIAFSLKEAAENDLEDEVHNAYSIILITDGGESCNGNICEVSKQLLEKKIFFKPYVLGLVDYAPLKAQYACLGSYLQVSSEKDIKPAISTIVDAYRTMLLLPNIISTKMQIPTVLTPKFITTEPKPVVTRPVQTAPPKKDTEIIITRPPVVKVDTPKPMPKPVVMKADTPKPAPQPVVVVKSTVTRDNIDILRIAPRRRMFPLHYVIAPAIKSPVMNLPVPYTAPPKPVAQQVIMPTKPETVAPTKQVVKQDPKKTQEPVATVTTDESAETTAGVYLTDGNGKFYNSSPELQFIDHNTGKLVLQFFRNVDRAGNPEPKKLPAGTYDVKLLSKDILLAKNVTVVDKKHNKINIKVTNGSLRFVYFNAPGKPVSKYIAKVRRRFDGPIKDVVQNCAEELPYESGTYYLEINTLPVTHRNVEIDFNVIQEVGIFEDGYIQFTNTYPVANVTLYQQKGFTYEKFYTANLSGDLSRQKIAILPGKYEVHYNRTPNVPYSKETVATFYIRSNEVTEISLP